MIFEWVIIAFPLPAPGGVISKCDLVVETFNFGCTLGEVVSVKKNIVRLNITFIFVFY